MALSRHAGRNRRMPRVGRSGFHYPDSVQTDEDRSEYDTFLAGLPLVNQLFFEDSLRLVKAWVGGGCPVDNWEETKRSLSNIASYLSRASDFAPVKHTILKRLWEESEKATPDTQAIQVVWAEMIAFAAS